jgi:hypothetical protein
MRNLNLKDALKNMGLKTIGATDKDVIFHVKPEELENMLEA